MPSPVGATEPSHGKMPRPMSRRRRRRPARTLLNAATAVSLVLCVATIVLWVRSYRAEDTFAWYDSRWYGRDYRLRAVGLLSDSGGAYLFLLRRSVMLGDDEAKDGVMRSYN